MTAAVLVGCGDDDVVDVGDGADAGSTVGGAPASVQSPDGRAELVMPPGIDAGGISIQEVEAEGATVAYELLPAGTTFTEPATLTITDVPAPERGAIALAVLGSADGDPELVEVETQYGEVDDAATVVVDVPHFSFVHVYLRHSSSQEQGSFNGYAALLAPYSVAVDVPFPVTTRASIHFERFEVLPFEGGIVGATVQVDEARFRGGLAAVNGTPATVADAPALSPVPIGELADTVSTLRCIEPGTVKVSLLARVEFDYHISWNGGSQNGTSVSRVRTAEEVLCEAEDPSTTIEATTTTTEPKPVVSEIRVDFRRPVTTYTVVASGGSAPLSFAWTMVGMDCGTPRTPWRQEGPTVSWSHGDAPPDSCTHQDTNHGVTVSVVVTGAGGSVTCALSGTEAQVITNPPCL